MNDTLLDLPEFRFELEQEIIDIIKINKIIFFNLICFGYYTQRSVYGAYPVGYALYTVLCFRAFIKIFLHHPIPLFLYIFRYTQSCFLPILLLFLICYLITALIIFFDFYNRVQKSLLNQRCPC